MTALSKPQCMACNQRYDEGAGEEPHPDMRYRGRDTRGGRDVRFFDCGACQARWNRHVGASERRWKPANG